MSALDEATNLRDRLVVRQLATDGLLDHRSEGRVGDRMARESKRRVGECQTLISFALRQPERRSAPSPRAR